MAYVPYGQNTTGGKQVAEVMAELQAVAAKLKDLGAWVSQIGPVPLETNADFSVPAGQGQAFNDTFIQIVQAYAAFYGDGSAGTNAEKISRLARGS